MPAPWRDRALLAPLVAAWRERATGRPLHRAACGPGWVHLQLEGDPREGLVLGALPGAVLVFPSASPWPEPLRVALPARRGDPLVAILRDGRLDEVALLRDDLVLHLAFTTPGGSRLLRHQLFGSRGGTIVLDAAARLLWTAHPSPHPCLLDPTATLALPAASASTAATDLAAWSAFGLARLARQRETALGEQLQRALERRLAAAARLGANLDADLARADRGEEQRRDAETLAAHLHAIPRGAATVTLPDPRDGRPRTVALDPALPPHANLARLFKLARRADRGRAVIAERRDAARADEALLAAAAADLAPLLVGPAADEADHEPAAAVLARLAALQAFAAAHAARLREAAGPAGRAPDEPSRPFRRYRIDGRWEVWVGRDSEENDELTHRASHPRDLWLHAQGVAGSHVVLRTGGRPDLVPRTVLAKAAALAAAHSKARHSGLVPVIWTERRYVRRPRQAAPGTAVCLREQNLFVEPGVAAGVEAI